MVTPLARPSVRVNQQFSRVAAAVGQDLGAFIYGPAASVYRYAKASEKAAIGLGAYDPTGALVDGEMVHLYNYPEKPAGGIIDASFVKLFCDSAFLRIHNDTSQLAVRVGRNGVRHSSKIYQTANGYTTNVGDRGLKVGDRVLVSGLDASSAAFSLASYIIGFDADKGSAAVAAAAAATGNKAAVSAAATVTAGSSNSGTITATATGTAYNGLALGLTGDTYTITVTTGGAYSAAKLSVVSASGLDNASGVTPAALASATAIGALGLTVTFAQGTDTNFTVGDTWTVVVARVYTLPSFTVTGTYTGTKDRNYILEVLTGGLLSAGTVRVRITSQDGTDTLAAVTLVESATPGTSTAISLGSYGPTVALVNVNGFVTGDKWTFAATAAPDQQVRTIRLAHDFPANVNDDTTAALSIQAFLVKDIEIPIRAATVGTYNFSVGATQLSVLAGITIEDAEWTESGVVAAVPLLAPAGFGNISQLYVQYRAWAPTASGIVTLAATDSLDSLLPGPTDPDNPLKYMLSIARGAAGSQPIRYFTVGDPANLAGWTAALTAASRERGTYGHVPLTQDYDILAQVFSHVQSQNGQDVNLYRVLWWGTPALSGKVVVDATTSSDAAAVLATVEDDSDSAGTQYTKFRLTSGNADLLALGVRAGDKVRYLYEIDGWGEEAYTERTVDSVLTATTFTVTEALSAAETVAKRVEIHRTYNAAELKAAYFAEVGRYSADTVRAVVSPTVHIGSYELPSYYAAGILAATRSSIPAQQTLSGYGIAEIANVTGLESFTEGDLAEISGSGGTVVNYDRQAGQVIVYRGVTTTPDMSILAKREESMVACRHANLFAIVDGLRVYAGNSNITDEASFMEDLAAMVRAELDSIKRDLQAKNRTPALLGQLIDLEIVDVKASEAFEDVLEITGTMTLGRPTNRIDFNVLIQ